MVSKLSADLVIVGGGPAGIAAAATATRFGVKCIILERGIQLGGQFFASQSKQPNLKFNKNYLAQELNFLSLIIENKIPTFTKVLIDNIDDTHMLYVYSEEEQLEIKCGFLLLATGARERVAPFTGWTLPRVMTMGAAQRLVNGSGVSPGSKVLVSGSGPLLLPGAASLINAGVRVVAVVEATSYIKLMKIGLYSLFHRGRAIQQALYCLNTLRKSRVPLLSNSVVIEARGQDHVNWVATQTIEGRERIQGWNVDSLVVSNGLEPNIRLARMLKCKMVYDETSEGFFPQYNRVMQSNIPWIYLAGEVVGIGGVEKALVEGQICGIQIALNLGRVKDQEVKGQLYELYKKRNRTIREFHSTLLSFIKPSRLSCIAQPETVVCRCENVCMDQLRKAVLEGANTMRDLKLQTRLGMGMCQGNCCEMPALQELAIQTNQSQAEIEMLNVRPPLEPISLEKMIR